MHFWTASSAAFIPYLCKKTISQNGGDPDFLMNKINTIIHKLCKIAPTLRSEKCMQIQDRW